MRLAEGEFEMQCGMPSGDAGWAQRFGSSGEGTATIHMWMKESGGEQKGRAPTWRHCTQRDIHGADGRRAFKGSEKKSEENKKRVLRKQVEERQELPVLKGCRVAM